MSVYCNRWRPRYADLRRAVARAQRPAQRKREVASSVSIQPARCRHRCRRPAAAAAARVAPWRESLLVHSVADAWPCVTTGGCKCYSFVSCTVPPATLGSGDV